MPADLILIAYDGSENSKRAVEYAGRFLESCRAVVVTAWEPMVRQAARMSGLSGGVMQPEWVPDEDTEDVALTDAKVTNSEGLELARSAGLHAEGRTLEIVNAVWTSIIEPPTNSTSTSSSPGPVAPPVCGRCCSPRSPTTSCATVTGRC